MSELEEVREQLKKTPLDQRIVLASYSKPELLELLLEDKHPLVMLSALDNPHLTEQRVQLMAQDAATPAEVLEKIAKNRAWMKTIKMQMAMIRNPHTPLSIAIEYLSGLTLMDLVHLLSGSGGMQPGLRQRMMDLFRQRATQLGDEQRIQLLGRGADISQILIDLGGAKVLAHAIKSGHLRQYQAVKLANSYQTPPQILMMLFDTPPWGQQFEVKWALLSNDNTPRDIQMRVYRSLSKSDQEKFKRENRNKAVRFQ